MTRYTFTILEEHHLALRRTLLRDENEYGALLLCGRSRHADPWTGEIEERALVREVIEVDPSAFVQRSPVSMTWSTTPLFRLAKRTLDNDEAICIAHSHPGGVPVFSSLDDKADDESMTIVFDRTDSDRPHFSLVMDSTGEFLVRGFERDRKPKAVDLARIVGDRFGIRYAHRGHGAHAREFERQVRAFGARCTEDLSRLRVGIVGCGGTGSAVACILGRIGVSHLLLVDADRVEETNLSRLHLSTRADSVLGRNKVDVLAEALAEIGLVRSVARIPRYVDAPECRDALRACDLIFGCTDDHLGRNLLNRLAHFYLIPIIDLGVLIEPNESDGYDSFDGRVTVVQPGYPCQVCRNLILPQRMLEEGLRRSDPQLYQERRRAGYLQGLPDPSPVVITFTTEIAAVAVNELLHRLTGFRGPLGHCAERVRRFDEVKNADTVPGGQRRPGCKLCNRRSYDGRGDVMPFLDMA